MRSAALCPLLCQPGKPPALHSWGRAFFCSRRVFFPALKMFLCHLGLKFMAQGMDVWITCCRFWEPESPGWECSLVLGQSKAACRGKGAEETWNWHSVVSGTCFFFFLQKGGSEHAIVTEGVQAVWGGGEIQSCLHGCQLRKLRGLRGRLQCTYLSMHNLAWLSAAATRACLCFSGAWHQSSLCLRCAAAMCVITFGSLGERFGAWGYARA